MQRSLTSSSHATSPPISIRPPSIDSLCMLEDEDSSLTAAQEVSSPSSIAATIGVVHEESIRDSIVLPPASDSTTTLGSRRPASPIHQSKQPFWRTSFFRGKWVWEITCIIFSIACVIAITILSSRLDGTWLSKWTLFLQPSTTFAILATAAQSSMMLVIAEILSQLKWLQMSLPKSQSVADFSTFDAASRGPFGSLRLFYLWKPQSIILPPMVYAASVMTIAALAMGPFTQQIISVQADNWVSKDGMNSTIPVTNYYNHQPTANGVSLFADDNGPVGMGMATKESLDVASDTQGSFYNGYYNLGKSFIDFSCPSSNCSWETFNSLGICSACQNVTDSVQITGAPETIVGVTTPGGWSTSFQAYDQVKAIANESFFYSTWDTLSANLVILLVVQRSRNIFEYGYIVTECSIQWCAKEYSNVSVRYHSVRDLPLWPVAGQDLGGLPRGITSYDNWDFLFTTDTGRRIVSTPFPPFIHSGLNVSIYDHLGLSSYFFTKFNFTSESKTALFGDRQDVASTLNNNSNSVTSAIMRSENGTLALGIIWHQEPSIKIRWAWLTLPLIVVVSSAVLLVSMILASRRYNAPRWKSSPLPLLFHGIRNWDDEEEHDLAEGRLEKMNQMEDRAKTKRVRIFTSPKGGRWLVE